MISRNYEYGNIGVWLSFNEVGQLQAIYNQTRAAFLLSPEQQGLAYPIYDLLLKFLPAPEKGLSTVYDSKEYKQVYAWIEGAVLVNSNDGVFAKYIHTYTGHQYRQRFGEITPESVTGLVNEASNAIGLMLAQRIIDNSGLLPSIEGVGAVDAGESARTVFIKNPHYPEGDYTGWAGTLLFSFLGYDRFFNEWLLETDSVVAKIDVGVGQDLTRTTKNLQGAYDFFSALQAHSASVKGFELWEKILTVLKPRLDNNNDDLLVNARKYIDYVYGSSAAIFNVEDILPFASPEKFHFSNLAVKVGALSNDVIFRYPQLGGKKLIVHAGEGNDSISIPNYLATGAHVLVDGGKGNDVLQAYQVAVAQRLSLADSDSALYANQFTLNSLGQPPATGPHVYAFSFNFVQLGATSDWFRIHRLSSAEEHLKVDLGGGGRYGNTVDFSKYSQGVKLNLVQDSYLALSLETGQQVLKADVVAGRAKGPILEIQNSENIIGTRGNDTLVGNSRANILDGGAGSNILWGGMGADIFIVNQGVSTIMDAEASDRLVIRLRVAGADKMLELKGGTILKARVDNANGTTVLLSDSYSAFLHPVMPNVYTYSPSLGGYPVLQPNLGGEFLVKYSLSGANLNINVRARTLEGGVTNTTAVVKGYEHGDLGLKFKEVIIPNLTIASAGQGLTVDQIKDTFVAAQRDLIKSWDAPGFNDVWYA